MNISHRVISTAALLLLSIISAFFLFREKMLLKEIKEKEQEASYYETLTLSPQPAYRIEATILDFDEKNLELTLTTKSRWFPLDGPVELKLAVTPDALIVSRVAIMDAEGIITDIKDRRLASLSDIPRGSFAFLVVHTDFGDPIKKARVTSIIIGGLATTPSGKP